MIAGTLELQMLTNLAKISSDMKQVERIVGQSMDKVGAAISKVKTALGAIGVGIGVGAFVHMIDGTIDALDKLNDLSKATGITVERLSGLQLAAKQSGGDLDSVAQSINKLSVNMGKDAEKFAKLGITAKDQIEAFKQLSDIFVKIEDPQLRASVAAAALGKQWSGAAPLLAEGSAKIQEMIDKGIRLSGVTGDAAQKADDFKDQIVELNTVMNAARNTMVSKMLPGLNDVAKAMRQAAEEGGTLTAIWVGLGGALAMLLGQTGLTPLIKIRQEVEALSDDLKKLEDQNKNVRGAMARGIIAQNEAEMARIRARLELLRQEEKLLLERAAFKPVKPSDGSGDAAAFDFLHGEEIAKARVKFEEQQSKELLAIISAEVAQRQKIRDMAHADSQMSDDDYYRDSLEDAKQAAESQIAALDFQMTSIERRMVQHSMFTKEWWEERTKAEANAAERNKIVVAFGNVAQISTMQAQKSSEAYGRSIEEVNIRIREMTGDIEGAARAAAELQRRDLMKRAVANNDAGAVAAIQREQGMLDIRIRMNRTESDFATVLGEVAIQQERIRILVDNNSISEIDALNAQSAANRKRLADLQAIADAYMEIAKASGIAADILKAQQMQLEVDKLRASTDLLAKSLNTDLLQAMRAPFVEWIMGTKKAKDAFNDFANSVARKLTDLYVDALSKNIFKAMGMDTSTGGGGPGGWLAKILGLGGTAGSGWGASTAAAQAVDTSYMAVLAGYASGTDYVPRTGPYMLHQGEKVIPANENNGGDVNLNVSIDARGADAGVEQRINVAVEKMRRSIVPIVMDAKRRNAFGTYIR